MRSSWSCSGSPRRGDHLALELGACEHAGPFAGEGLVLALGGDPQVGAAEEYGRGLARVVARDRKCAELRRERRGAAPWAGDHADLPAVGDDPPEVALGQGLVLL